MCGKAPKPPRITEIPKPPQPTETAIRVQQTAEQAIQEAGGVDRQTMQRFDVRNLPSNVQIPR